MRHLAIAACLVVTTARSAAVASPHHKHEKANHTETDRVALASDLDGESDELVDAPVRVHRHRLAPATKDWHLAIGPYLWASAVDANVSLGPAASVSSGVDFIRLEKHARYGAEVLSEARYRRFSVTGDLMYGVVAIDGGTTVGPLMVQLSGTASSLLAEGGVGYLVAGSEQSQVALEARGGARYQRTAITAAVAVDDSMIASQTSVDAGADAIAGARVFVRPSSRVTASGTFDVGVLGSSSTTWSATVDASVRFTSHAQLSIGWRTLTIERANVSMVMHGPRAALQLLF